MDKTHIHSNGAKAPQSGGKEGVAKEAQNAQAAPKQDSELEAMRKIGEEYKNTLQRLQAEFENAAKRSEREREEFRKIVNARVLEEFLPLVDSLSEGVKHAQQSGNKQMQEGMAKISAQLLKTLESNGVKPIQTMGKKFDASLHECLLTAKDEKKDDGAILEEFAKGYTLNGKVLRPAKVSVNKKE